MSKKSESIALFRFGVIFPLLQEGLNRGEQSQIIEKLSSKEYDIPYSKKNRLSKSTILNWLYSYKKERDISSLEPKARNDKGISKVIDEDTANEIIKRHRANSNVPTTTILKSLLEENIVIKPISKASAYRLIKEADSNYLPSNEKDRRRFEMEGCNDMWELDAMVIAKPNVIDESGKKYKARIFALIDDKSRYIVNAKAYLGEKATDLMDCLWGAFNKNGLPRKIYTDNGSAMRDQRIALGLASLEVQYIFAKPYQPQGKAKLERFWRTVRMQFLPLLPQKEITLYELNKKLSQYIKEYNTRFHSGIGCSPEERYFNEVKAVRVAPANLPKYFRHEEERKVSASRTISLNNTLYEVPIGYVGKKIKLRYFDYSEVEAFFNDESIGFIKPVDLNWNSYAHRLSNTSNREE